MNEMKMKANKTRNELKVSDSNTYRLKNEERTKNGEERRKIFIGLLTETSRKRYGSTSTRFFFAKTCFLPKITEMHSLGVMNIFETAPLSLFIGKKGGGACCPEASWGRFLSTPQLISSLPFSYCTEKLQKHYESVSDLIFIFFSLPFRQY